MMDATMKNAKILIVDDQQVNIDILMDFLEIQGYGNVRFTTDSREVIQLLKDYDPDIILLDLLMPLLSGFEVMEQLKTLVPKNTYLPILVLTADATIETKRKALQCGASDFLTKPFDLIELQARVNTHLQIRFKNELINQYASELEKLIATRNKFFSIIAHDLRNPFTGIENFIKIILKFKKYDPVEIENQLETISSTAQQGRELLENLLRWSKSQTGAIEINLTDIKLNDVITKCQGLIQAQADNKEINISSSIEDEIILESDNDMLETILRNLLSNAVKFTPQAGSVIIKARKEDDKVEVSVTDTGIGIAQSEMDNLFRTDRNLQTKKGTANEPGSGLGLILCKEFIDKLGGVIWAESKIGQGTKFSFTLPLHKQALSN